MAPSGKPSAASRRKSIKGILILKVSPKALQMLQPNIKGNGLNSDHSSTPTISSQHHSTATENTQLSKSQTPDQPETPGSTSLLPPTDTSKKRGVKRSSNSVFGSDAVSAARSRSKPGPKKKARHEDTAADKPSYNPKVLNATATKLGPKANQGAINAGLRALDRSGTPCRKWSKESFKLKSFTGVCWEIPRWKAPPKIIMIGTEENSCNTTRCNNTKENSQAESEQSEKSSNVIDIEIGSTNSLLDCSPLPQTTSSGEEF
ncbi:putative duf1711 domain-containing protein [Golovinomyces cichoracearum]|uniref:Putative duf1711 domain-containing protein n=1 Tax=Golovinomyces cichoracearum TaxID=62708 RepID=A0A420JBA6_9PEZI|nr:putative duf1711 domain-containing protein [Golovinomyces cichoracearum]